MNKTKKLFSVILISVFVLLFAVGCATDPLDPQTTTTVATEDSKKPEKEIKEEDYKNNIDGLCDYLEDKNYISGERLEMASDLIGAEKGYRYIFDLSGDKGRDITLEVYSYNKEKLDDVAKKVISDVKNNGEFVIFDLEPVKAELLNNERFLVAYKDVKLKDKDKDGPEDNKERKDNIIKTIDEFYNK